MAASTVDCPHMYLAKPRPLILIATLLFVALTVRLGFWQLGRGQYKARLAAAYTAADVRPPQAWQGELGDAAWYKRFTVHGHWLPEGAILLDNRTLDGKAGFHALAPLRLDDGKLLLVNRGWLPKGAATPSPPPLPGTEAVITIRLTPPTQHYVQLASDAGSSRIWQNLDWTRYKALVKAEPVPALGLSLSADDGLRQDWPPPDLGIEKHYAYAGQWFLFAGLAIFFFIRFHWRRSPT